ncbi:MAG TPA: EamA family transporter [Rubricoccaceae bacterium]|nr:EamA family transporter [Rubricoccaceae bacterium]
MGWLAAAVACSVAIAALFERAERRGVDRLAMLAVNYVVAGAVAAVLLPAPVRAAGLPPAPLVGLGSLAGALFLAGFFLLSASIRAVGMGLATGVMRLSVVVPVLASWAVWGERPSALQLVGLALAGAAFFLLAKQDRASERPGDGLVRGTALLALLFVVGGLVDTSLKAFGAEFGAEYPEPLFLLVVFGVAALLGGALVLARGWRTRRWPRAEVLVWGALIGLANYGSAAFLLRALAVLPGPVAFPANNVAIVVGAALVGWAFFGERPTRRHLFGLAVAALALALLWG